MECTRHFTGTVYVVNDGATALHDHARLGLTLPPGGHVDHRELPHEAALREAREETGLDPTLLADAAGPTTDTGRPLPRPRHQMLYDINVHDGAVGHQHVDHIYYATVPSRAIDPVDGEASAEEWAWYTAAELGESGLPSDVVRFGTEAIRAAESRS